jgi:hypothetical protein
MDNNIIAHNEVTEKGAGIYLQGAFSRLRHNTLAQNTGGDGSGIHVGTSAEVVMTNTIVVSHAVGITVTTGSTATLHATLWGDGIWANGVNWAGDGTNLTHTGDVWGDPAFADPENDDYHIGSASAARDAGVDAGLTEDIDGDPRPGGAGYDIGADEFRSKIYLPLVMRNFP